MTARLSLAAQVLARALPTMPERTRQHPGSRQFRSAVAATLPDGLTLSRAELRRGWAELERSLAPTLRGEGDR